ncbi:MAG: hypothetical protein HQK54_10530 [Oligoflexales bacterium]|nr:hypothetical protein [Oligoflexales bacterium]
MNGSSEIIKLLTEIAFMAALRGKSAEAKTILDGIESRMDRDPGALIIGRALTALSLRNFDEAALLLETLCRDKRPSPEAKALLGLVHHVSGSEMKKRETLFELLKSEDSGARRLAQSLL